MTPTPDPTLEPISVVVLCGGTAGRFGSDKGLATFRGEVLVERLARILGALGDDLFVSTNRLDAYAYLGRRLVPDLHRARGPLGGLQASLAAARHDLLAVVACDMPFASPTLLRHLANRAARHDAVVPQRLRPPKPPRGARPGDVPASPGLVLQPEPLHAVYSRSALAHLTHSVEGGQLRPRVFLEEIDTLYVPPEEWDAVTPGGVRCFANFNTLEDLRKLEEEEERAG
jgi:molybdopterin-guanine dinucleotide biosynthesis protein A